MMESLKDINESLEISNQNSQSSEESKPTISEIVKLAKDWLPETKQQLMTRGEEPELPLKRLPTLNRLIWGIHKGKMTVIAGRTSQAKSVVATNIAWDLASQRKKVFFISLEMSVHQILERMFCLEHKVNNYELLTGKLAKSDYLKKTWESFHGSVNAMPMIMTDMIGRNWEEVDKVVSGFGKKPDIVIIDHIQEISAAGLKKMEAIEEYLNHMRTLAIRNHFALLLCSQINRLGQAEKNRRPELHQLKGSGAIEEKADVVGLLHWQYHYDDTAEKNLLELNIAKNRCGMTGKINLRFIPEYSRLENYEHVENSQRFDAGRRAAGERCEENSVHSTVIQQGNNSDSDRKVVNPEDIIWEE